MFAKLIAVILLFALTSSCAVPEMNPEYAIEAIKLPDGQTIYFKREVRGITGNYDVIAVSANSDPCASCDPKTDYCLAAMGPEAVYYKIEAETLHLFAHGGINSPEKFPLPIKIEIHDISSVPAQDEFKRKMSRDGVKKLPLTATDKCK